MARHTETRWELGEASLVRLAAEAKQFKGESLGRDAWRRLRRSRPSFIALVFLAVFGLTSILVPLLPLVPLRPSSPRGPAREHGLRHQPAQPHRT